MLPARQTGDFDHGLDTVPDSVEDAVVTDQKFPYQDVELEVVHDSNGGPLVRPKEKPKY